MIQLCRLLDTYRAAWTNSLNRDYPNVSPEEERELRRFYGTGYLYSRDGAACDLHSGANCPAQTDDASPAGAHGFTQNDTGDRHHRRHRGEESAGRR